MRDFYKRYERHLTLEEVGEKGQLKLLNSRVLVIGAGGLGCPVIQYLIGGGIGTVGIVDGDTVSLDNLHRQVLFTADDVGKSKVEAVCDRLSGYNSDVAIQVYHEFLDHELAAKLFPVFDVIIDASDNFDTRHLINDAAVFFNKTVVSGSVFRYEGQLAVFNYKEGPTYRCLFPQEDKKGFGCEETGVLGPVVGVLGSMMAMECMKVILQMADVLSGKLLIMDTKSWEQSFVSFPKCDKQIENAKKGFSEIKEVYV